MEEQLTPVVTATLPGDRTAEQTDKNQLHATPLKTPFAKIALALSGGGFRAASFSIGTMSYLHHLKYKDPEGKERSLLDNVEFISSASGGTFPAILFSSYRKKGLPFETVYKDIRTFMNGETLLEEVLAIMNEDKEWEDEDKSRNFINAFAKIYDRKLFRGETFGVYWGEGLPDESGQPVEPGLTAGPGQPVESRQPGGPGQPGQPAQPVDRQDVEVCFNATEFYRGLSFRWQAGGPVSVSPGGTSVDGKTGNQYIYFNKIDKTALGTLKQIKLGDIMASSSCFPAGFEPIIYPRDFSYPARDDVKNKKGLDCNTLEQAMIITDYNNRPRLLDTPIGLMDGGVDDNQGLYSAMLADKRRRLNDPASGFDLMIVSDVASYFMDPYVPPPSVETGSYRKKNVASIGGGLRNAVARLSSILKITGIVSMVLLVLAIMLLVFAEPGGWMNLGFLLLSPAILTLVLVALAIGYKEGNPMIGRLTGSLAASDKELIASLKAGTPAIANFSDAALGSMVKYLKGARISVLEQMLKTRVGSMLSLLLDINLKQTRRLIFDIFFGNFYGKDVWGNRRVFNVIYELSLFNITSRESNIRGKFEAGDADLLLKGCTKLNSVAEIASTMGTTLWYDHQDAASKRMDKVVACGQFTTCAKMLEYVLALEKILQREKSLAPADRTLQFGDFDQQLFAAMRKQLEDDWKAFKDDPFFLL